MYIFRDSYNYFNKVWLCESLKCLPREWLSLQTGCACHKQYVPSSFAVTQSLCPLAGLVCCCCWCWFCWLVYIIVGLFICSLLSYRDDQGPSVSPQTISTGQQAGLPILLGNHAKPINQLENRQQKGEINDEPHAMPSKWKCGLPLVWWGKCQVSGCFTSFLQTSSPSPDNLPLTSGMKLGETEQVRVV